MNVVLVHGSFGNPYENWFPWIVKELSQKKIPCVVPSFPTPNHQLYDDWERLMDYYYSIDVINEDTVFVGHSCGAIFLIHFILKHQIRCKGIICVSGYNNFVSGVEMMDQLNESFYVANNEINASQFVDHIIAFYGDDDPFIPQRILESFADGIGGEKHSVHLAGHFNEAAGYTKCEEVLDAVIKCFD